MKLLKEVSEAAMVAAFLKAEFSSPRFSKNLKGAMQTVGTEEGVITHPDITDRHDNELRAQVLGEYRGYRQNREVFQGLPDNLTWYDAQLLRDEVGNLRYIDYSYWNELTDNTRLVKDAVKNIRRGKIAFNVPNDQFLALAEKLRYASHELEPIIVWGQDIGSPLEILEGHLRATALGIAGEEAPPFAKVLVGLVNAPRH